MDTVGCRMAGYADRRVSAPVHRAIAAFCDRPAVEYRETRVGINARLADAARPLERHPVRHATLCARGHTMRLQDRPC